METATQRRFQRLWVYTWLIVLLQDPWLEPPLLEYRGVADIINLSCRNQNCGWNSVKRSSASTLKLVKPFRNRIFEALNISLLYSETSFTQGAVLVFKSALLGILLEPADPKLAHNGVPGKNKWNE